MTRKYLKTKTFDISGLLSSFLEISELKASFIICIIRIIKYAELKYFQAVRFS